jgi:hypothetical protein
MSRDFDDEALRAAYEPALRESTTTHGRDCPSETALLSAVRGEGSEAERLRVLVHALKCPACRRCTRCRAVRETQRLRHFEMSHGAVGCPRRWPLR